jgi:hypothetical protein
MKIRYLAPAVLAVALTAVASLGFVPAAAADPTTTNPATFAQLQATLEAQLAARQVQLTKLTAAVSASTTLSASDAAALQSSLSAETSNIDALVASVPTETTIAELRADQQAMFRDNRVFAVMTPQVNLTIAADTVDANAGKILAGDPTIEAALTARQSDDGYARAAGLFAESTAHATVAQSAMTSQSATVLAQTAAGFPGNEHFFVQARIEILRGRIDLIRARADLGLVERWINRHPVAP